MASTLEQELLADFAESDEELELANDGEPTVADGAAADEDDEMVDEEAEYAKAQNKAPSDIRRAQELNDNLESLLKQIDEVQGMEAVVMDGESLEESPEYALLKDANEFSTSIDGEIAAVHKFIRDVFSIKFPGLETLIQNPLDYGRTVAVIQNHPLNDLKALAQTADNMIGIPLKDILSPAQQMVVFVEATRAEGRNLTDAELKVVVDACKLLLDLDKARSKLTDFVQSRMNLYAPNLTILVGSLTAAQLINSAGGLSGLAKTPACNLAPLGTNKASGLGLATNIGVRNQGFIYYSPILATVRQDLKKQALRIVSAKAILAARVDMSRTAPDGSTGHELRAECEKRLDKLTEVNGQAAGKRALPVPLEQPSRKRGGRRARKAKEATAMTEIRKAQNRMTFGKEEKEVGYGDSTKGMGMVGATDTGRLRAQQIDPKTRAKLSKKTPGWGGDTTLGAASSLKGFGGSGTATSLRAQGLRTNGVGLGGAGTSSIAFTPVQGLELVDPKVREDMNRKRKADEDRWFKGGSFTALSGANSKVDAGGFKVPALPPTKKPKTDE
jgi:U4/U6 small nuclear ribonucleoprotein PRP31